jgi:uncharacterized protein
MPQPRPGLTRPGVQHQGALHQVRIPNPHARRRAPVHLDLRAKRQLEAYPFLIDRTPYSVGPYGVDQYRKHLGPAPEFDKAGYIFVFQDVRGRYMSEGTFIEMRPHIDNKKSKQDVDDASDLYDTIDWLLKNVPNNNGNAGIWGISYPGFFTSASIIDSHPALKAASPQAPMTDLFMGDDAYHGGAFMLNANFGFYSSFKPQENPQLPPKTFVPFDYGTKDGYEFYLNVGPIGISQNIWRARARCSTTNCITIPYDDYWKARNLAPHMKNIHCAVLTVGRMVRCRGSAGTVLHLSTPSTKIIPGFSMRWLLAPGCTADGPGSMASIWDEWSSPPTPATTTAAIFCFPFFEQYLKGNGDAKLAQSLCFRNRHKRVEKIFSLASERMPSEDSLFPRHGELSFDPPGAETAEAALR